MGQRTIIEPVDLEFLRSIYFDRKILIRTTEIFLGSGFFPQKASTLIQINISSSEEFLFSIADK